MRLCCSIREKLSFWRNPAFSLVIREEVPFVGGYTHVGGTDQELLLLQGVCNLHVHAILRGVPPLVQAGEHMHPRCSCIASQPDIDLDVMPLSYLTVIYAMLLYSAPTEAVKPGPRRMHCLLPAEKLTDRLSCVDLDARL